MVTHLFSIKVIKNKISIYEFFIVDPLHIFKDLKLALLYSLSTILYKLKQKSKEKEVVLIRWKIKIIFL